MTAIILAGGRGTRLEPWPAPKCLLPINGVTILQRLLRHVLNPLITRAVICTGYRAEDIEASVDAHRWPDSKVVFSNAGEDVPMGMRLLKALEHGQQRVLICYGDDLADVNVIALLKQHRDDGALMTFASVIQKVGGGVVAADGVFDHEIIHEDHTVEVNIGFVVVEPECWAFLQSEDGLSGWINKVARETDKVRIYHHKGKRATVNSLADLKAAEEIWR